MTLGRAYLIRKLQERGVSRRMAVRILDEVFEAMKEALKQGQDVELPFGSLRVVPQVRRPKRGWHLNRITTLYKKPFTVTLTDG